MRPDPDRKPASPAPLPHLLDRLDEIDADWLTAALQAAGHRDARVTAFEIAPIGAGNVSDTVRVRLRFAGPTDAPGSIVCKFRSSEANADAHGISSGSYYREIGSYRMLAAAGAACRVPQVHWIDGHRENINLVMEDLCDAARAGNQIAGCGITDAESVIVELARLHAAFFPMARRDVPEWAMSMADTADYWSAAIDRALPVIRDKVADRLTAQEMATIEDARTIARAWYELPMSRGTLTHGDPRVDNILFTDTPAGVQAILIDWQLTGWRNPMHDVGYFLSGSVSIEDRRAHERALLARYAETFGADRDYAPATMIEDYRVQLLSGLMTTVASYGLIPLTPDYDRLLITLLRRNAAAAADWGSIAAVRAAAT